MANTPAAVPAIAASRSASAKTMFGDLPPSSTDTLVMESAAERRTSRPTADDPVNDTLSTPGFATSAAPARAPPVTTCSTPSGSPASASRAGSRSEVRGVCSAGLSTTQQPAASAGAIFWVASIRG